MWKRRKKTAEVLPWYRKPTYKGKMREEEKRILDSFRMKEKHPAATTDDLPEEVTSYINRIEFELYDLKQEKLMQNCLAVSAFAAVCLYLSYFGLPDITIWSYIAGTGMLIFPWFVYKSESKKLDAAHLTWDREPGTLSATDEAIREEWELEYLVHASRAQERATRTSE